MLFKKTNYLTKKYMQDKYIKYDRKKVYENKTNFMEFLKQIEEEFYTHEFKEDKRYVCVSRHRFLIDEMSELYLTKKQCEEKHLDKCPTVWCLDSLLELIFYPNNLTISAHESLIKSSIIYQDKTFNECREIYESYNKDGIISLNERDHIMHALNMIKDSLKKCNEKLEWND
ncbi:MAG: hypothetical protein IJN90_01560 [Bacilli bacterium]|nr:hypothetical protein [Bacilli bacterium]